MELHIQGKPDGFSYAGLRREPEMISKEKGTNGVELDMVVMKGNVGIEAILGTEGNEKICVIFTFVISRWNKTNKEMLKKETKILKKRVNNLIYYQYGLVNESCLILKKL